MKRFLRVKGVGEHIQRPVIQFLSITVLIADDTVKNSGKIKIPLFHRVVPPVYASDYKGNEVIWIPFYWKNIQKKIDRRCRLLYNNTQYIAKRYEYYESNVFRMRNGERMDAYVREKRVKI